MKLRARLNRDREELVLEGVDPVTCREKLGGDVDLQGRCVLRPERLEEER